jgi:hypothetical protein
MAHFVPLLLPNISTTRQKLMNKKAYQSVEKLEQVCNVYEIPLPKLIPFCENESVHLFMDDRNQLAKWLLKQFPRLAFPFKKPFDHWLFDFCENHSDFYIIDNYSLLDVLSALIHFFEQSKHKDELFSILLKEADANKNVCPSGYFSFMINSISGFPDVPTFVGSPFQHEKATIFHLLNTCIDFSDPTTIFSQIEKLFEQYPFTPNILKILYMYTQTHWNIIDGKVQNVKK